LRNIYENRLEHTKNMAIASSVGASGSLGEFVKEIDAMLNPPKPNDPKEVMLQLDKQIE
jgi:hypothetical protein